MTKPEDLYKDADLQGFGPLVTRIAELELEVSRLKEVVAAKPPESGKAVRVEMNTTPAGTPCLIVTAPVYFEEERLAELIASTMVLWFETAAALAAQKAEEAEPRDR